MQIYSIGVQQVQQAQSNSTKSANKLSSGDRLHKLGTDSAGLSVSSRQKSDARSLQMASRNIQDGLTLTDTIASALNSMKDLLVRGRELAVQASNSTYDDTQRSQMNVEFQNLLEEFSTQAQRTEWNGISVLTSTNSDFTLQIGRDNTSSSQLTVDLSSFLSTLTNISTTNGTTLNGTKTNGIATQSTAQKVMVDMDDALNNVYEKLASAGSIQKRLEHTLENNYSKTNSSKVSASRISDADYAVETAEMTKNQILLQSGTAAMNKVKEIASASLSLLS